MVDGPKVTPLDHLVVLDKLVQESPKNIKTAWLRHHRTRDCIGAVLEAPSFAQLEARTRDSPMFVFPLPRGQGYVSMLFQARGHVHLYTELAAYKERGEQAVPALSCVFYTELRDTKGLVLMRGEVNVKQLQPTDAAFLGNQTTLWYHDEERYAHVHAFNHAPSTFDFSKVVEKMSTL